MSPINRIVLTNGRTRVPKPTLSEPQPMVLLPTPTDKLKQIFRDHPGTLILVGLTVGGLLGWLTSRRSR